MIRGLLAGAALALALASSAFALPAGTLVYQYNNYTHITTNATTSIKSGSGLLSRVCVNTKGASANTLTIYDNTAASGTVIGVMDTTTGVGCAIFDVAFKTGLTVVTATGTAADVTVGWR